jgi:hypothetical protein
MGVNINKECKSRNREINAGGDVLPGFTGHFPCRGSITLPDDASVSHHTDNHIKHVYTRDTGDDKRFLHMELDGEGLDCRNLQISSASVDVARDCLPRFYLEYRLVEESDQINTVQHVLGTGFAPSKTGYRFRHEVLLSSRIY